MSNDNQQNKKVFNEDSTQNNIVSKNNLSRRETFTAQEKSIEEDYIPPTYISETVKPADKILKKAEVKKISNDKKE